MSGETQVSSESRPRQRIPAWLIRSIWKGHRAILRVTGGRAGLRTATSARWGTLRLHTTGRQTGKERIAILGFIEDGANLVSPAMNGWLEPEPAWWLNLQANPSATIELPDGSTRAVTARRAIAEERSRLWQRLVDLGTAAYTDANAEKRPVETAIVVFEPLSRGLPPATVTWPA
jgi:deazaflavin-dependent oxidoreductase (nitroreductase family)